MKIFNLKIDVKSFFRRGVGKINDVFGVYLITGYQGSGKTYTAVMLIHELLDHKIYTNIHSLNIKGADIVKFTELDEITGNIENDRVFVIDELSKKFTKESKQDRKFYSWLQQSRKRRRIVLLITQEYLQVPQWLRGVAREIYTTSKIPILPLFKTQKGFAVLDDETKEWNVEPHYTWIYKRTKKVASCYDTMEPINTL